MQSYWAVKIIAKVLTVGQEDIDEGFVAAYEYELGERACCYLRVDFMSVL
jgi:hypothetical protein